MKKQFSTFIKNLIDILKRPEMSVLPGQLAYFFILSLVPAATIIGYLASIFNLKTSDISAYFNITISPAITDMLKPVINSSGISFGLICIVIFGIYLVSNGTNSVIIAANNIYGIEQKPFVVRRIKAILMVFIIILLFLFILTVPLLGTFLLSLIEKATGYSEIYNLMNILKMPFSWFVIFIFIKMLYTLAPDKHIASNKVNRGALFASLLWIISTEAYLFYVTNYAKYGVLYSGLSNIAVLMIWMYILSTIFVIGLAINYKEEDNYQEKP